MTPDIPTPDVPHPDDYAPGGPDSDYLTPDTEIPDIDDPPRCPYCDRPFRSSHLKRLHVGEIHPEACTPAERDAYEDAREDERDDLFTYHIKIAFGIGTLYVVMVMVLLVVL